MMRAYLKNKSRKTEAFLYSEVLYEDVTTVAGDRICSCQCAQDATGAV